MATIPDTDKGIALKMFQSLRKKTGQYLDQYDAQVRPGVAQVTELNFEDDGLLSAAVNSNNEKQFYEIRDKDRGRKIAYFL